MFRTYGRFTTSEQILFTSLAPQLIDFLVKSLMTPSAPSDSQCFLPSKIGYQGGGGLSLKIFLGNPNPTLLELCCFHDFMSLPTKKLQYKNAAVMTLNSCLACNWKLQMKGCHELIAVFLKHFSFENNQKNFV